MEVAKIKDKLSDFRFISFKNLVQNKRKHYFSVSGFFRIVSSLFLLVNESVLAESADHLNFREVQIGASGEFLVPESQQDSSPRFFNIIPSSVGQQGAGLFRSRSGEAPPVNFGYEFQEGYHFPLRGSLPYPIHATSRVQPWSDSWWPRYLGQLAWPYQQAGYPERNGDQPVVNFSRYKSRFFSERRSSGGIFSRATAGQMSASELRSLSAAEKLDLWAGDQNFSLTTNNWERGRPGVAYWEGICHGWSSAAIHEARPRKSVIVKSPAGRAISILPSDIKGYLSTLHAYGTKPNAFLLGSRCGFREAPGAPPRAVFGVNQSGCNDLNPANWHAVVTTILGRYQEALIIDREANSEVWNQPVSGYSLQFVHPVTRVVSDQPEAAMVRRGPTGTRRCGVFGSGRCVTLGTFPGDSSGTHRSSNAAVVVGVRMSLDYLEEHDPPLSDDTDDESKDEKTTVQLYYDLELDANGLVVGGEWHPEWTQGDEEKLRPDFVWFYSRNHGNWFPRTDGDRNVTGHAWANYGFAVTDTSPGALAAIEVTPEFQRLNVMPQSFRFGHRAAANNGSLFVKNPQPLGELVKLLLDLSK